MRHPAFALTLGLAFTSPAIAAHPAGSYPALDSWGNPACR